MALDRAKAFDADNGFIIGDGSWISSGVAAPTHAANNGDVYHRTGTTTEEFYRYESGAWVLKTFGVGGALKSGEIVKATFAGNPKTATVTFGTAFSDTNYAVALIIVAGDNTTATFTPAIEFKAAGSFKINLNANNINDLIAVTWIATAYNNP